MIFQLCIDVYAAQQVVAYFCGYIGLDGCELTCSGVHWSTWADFTVVFFLTPSFLTIWICFRLVSIWWNRRLQRGRKRLCQGFQDSTAMVRFLEMHFWRRACYVCKTCSRTRLADIREKLEGFSLEIAVCRLPLLLWVLWNLHQHLNSLSLWALWLCGSPGLWLSPPVLRNTNQ